MNDSEISLNWDDSINVVCHLKRKQTPITSYVNNDDIVQKISFGFDYDFEGKSDFFPFEFPEQLKNLDFQILVITGSSGSGKSVFSKYFGKEEDVEWDNDKAVVSNFDSAEDASSRLNAVGLSSIPTWCRPYSVLSIGEQFRANLARRLKSRCVIDEFTSTVNRETAMSCSASVAKYIRKNNLKGCVFVSCHRDFIDVLCPDYVIDLDTECLYDTRRLLRRRFNLQVYETDLKREMWSIFERHHYLSADINISCKMFIAYLNDEPVACCAVLPQPGVHDANGNAWRIHRLVVLPDFQGLGIATKLLEYICDLFAYHGKIVYLRTSHIKLINYMKKSLKWYGNGKLMHSIPEYGLLTGRKINEKRLSASFKYVGGCSNNSQYAYNKIVFPKQVIQEKQPVYTELNLF